MSITGQGMWAQPDDVEAAHAVLKRAVELGVNFIDTADAYGPDSSVSFTDSIQALIDLQNEGNIKHIGVSNVTLDLLKQSTAMTKVVSVQNHYNFEHRADSEPVLQYCQEQGIAFIPYFPIGGNQGDPTEAELAQIAEKHDASSRQIALAWLLQHSPVILPIPGTSTVEHLESSIAAANIELDDEDVAALDAPTD
jgi:pyridoxine 4-dehydrogenase